MDKSRTLRHIQERRGREQHVVVNQARAMAYLNHDVTKAVARDGVAGDAGSDSLPVKPDTTDTVYKYVVLDDHIYCSVELNTANLGAAELDVGIDVVNVIVLYCGKDSPEVSDYSGLAAVVNMVVAYNMRADVVFIPAHVIGLEDGLKLTIEANQFALCNPTVLP